jgi:hypothetical protein
MLDVFVIQCEDVGGGGQIGKRDCGVVYDGYAVVRRVEMDVDGFAGFFYGLVIGLGFVVGA